MVRAMIRGKYDRDAETAAIKIMLSASPGTGGRQRQRETNVWDTITEYTGEIAEWVDTNLPENVPAP